MRVGIAIVVLMLSLQGLGSEPSRLFVGVRENLLFKGLNLHLQDDGGGNISTLGVTYHPKVMPTAPTQILGVEIAVHPSVAAATDQREAVSEGLAIACDQPDIGLSVGEDRRVLSQNVDRGGIIWFRRVNVTITVVWAGNSERALTTAARLDAAIRDNREIAPQGVFAELPEIEASGVDDPLTVGVSQVVTPTLRGLGPPDGQKILVEWASGLAKVEHVSDKITVSKRVPDMSNAVESALASQPAKIRIYAAGRLNVFVSKEFTLPESGS